MGYKLLSVRGDTTYKNVTEKERKKNMEFLKAILGEELYNQFISKINEFNGNEANKDKQIKLANLTDGAYVSKDKYASLETDLSGKSSELEKANNLIEELKKSTGKDEGLQQKISDYESEIETLKRENADLKTENALKFALVAAGAKDVDYLVFKAKEKGEVKLDDDGKIKGEDDLISGLKTQIPSMFEASTTTQNQNRKVLENNLPNKNDNQGITKEQFNRMSYAQRNKLFNENPELYHELKKN